MGAASYNSGHQVVYKGPPTSKTRFRKQFCFFPPPYPAACAIPRPNLKFATTAREQNFTKSHIRAPGISSHGYTRELNGLLKQNVEK